MAIKPVDDYEALMKARVDEDMRVLTSRVNMLIGINVGVFAAVIALLL
ncbi:MAG: hypothetical protein AB7U75_17375 [Hyphomicrobiaceae bacterium]